MKKILATLSIGTVLILCVIGGPAVHTAAQTSTSTATATATATPSATPVAPPVQGNQLPVMMYVDTVQGAGGSPAPAVGCSQTNLFRQGQVVVFRMYGVNVALNGKALKPWNVKSVMVNVPGIAPIPMAYGAHGTAPNAVSFWSAPFKTTGYPLGVVDFTIVVKTKANAKFHAKAMTATYSQAGFSPTSRLTITP